MGLTTSTGQSVSANALAGIVKAVQGAQPAPGAGASVPGLLGAVTSQVSKVPPAGSVTLGQHTVSQTALSSLAKAMQGVKK
jgi:hypothetical protein